MCQALSRISIATASNMSCSPPSSKQLKLACPVNGLTDVDLEEIFKRLPPYERLIVSEVCRRWYELSRKAWLDVGTIDVTPIPGGHIGAIVKQCPQLKSVFASQKSFALSELSGLCKVTSISSLRFYGCKFELALALPELTHNVFVEIFKEQLAHVPLKEFILLDAYFWQHRAANVSWPKWAFDVSLLPISLTHLQLCGLYTTGDIQHLYRLFLRGVERLQNLECCILNNAACLPTEFRDGICYDFITCGLLSDQPHTFEKIGTLKNLKELSIGWPFFFYRDSFEDLLASLPKLEVLVLNTIDSDFVNVAALAQPITESSVLRILVLSGGFVNKAPPFLIPARKRFPCGFGSDPLPLLHIFVGKEASENIRFTKSTSDAAIIHPINQPMPEFLEREDIAPIFEGVWVAERIKEMARHGGKLWNYEAFDTASSLQHN